MNRDPRFKACPECRGRLLVDAVNCTKCGWNKDQEHSALDSAKRSRRCSCGEPASVYDQGGIGRCSACDARRRFGEPRADGPGHDVWRRALEGLKRAPARAREPGDDDEAPA